MIIVLQQLPQLAGPQEDGYHGLVPKRALYMRPEAAGELLALEKTTGGLVYTDILRSAASILQAYRGKVTPSGQHIAQPVAYSFHGYGGCVDVDIDACKKKLGVDYAGLITVMESHGFYCHRRDGAAGEGQSESWHFNYLGDDGPRLIAATTDKHATWSGPAEAMIQKWYGDQLALTDDQVTALLPVAHATDVKDFQRQWDLTVDGIAGPRTRRVLAFVTATMKITPLPQANV
jgi:peptidoglycan hydrolase-like protein with peptidoglycan-binding domain